MDLLKILDTKPVPSIVDARSLGASGDVSGDYWLPAAMCHYQKELTDQIVSLHYSDILRYFETSDYREDVVLESMRTMCQNSALVATHPFLLIDHYMPKSLITRDIPSHLAETSGKFSVLRDLISLVQDYETDTAIVCKPGRTTDLVEGLLLGNKVSIKRYDGHSIKSKQKKPKKPQSCTCHIFPSESWDTKKFPLSKETPQFDMLIAVDPSVDTTTKEIKSILKYGRSKTDTLKTSPIVRLVTINSFDHCDLYFGKKFGPGSTEYLESVTAGVVVLRDRVGILPPDLRPIYSQHLGYLVEWLENSTIPWPLPDIYPIKKYTSMDVERSLLSEVNYSQVEDFSSAFENNNSTKKRGRGKNSSPNDSRDNQGGSSKKVPTFYQLKRLKNDYSKNPTKQSQGILTGIITNDENMSSNYHLSSEILTHKLIQSMGQIYGDIHRQHKELFMYQDVNSMEDDHVQFYGKESKQMKEKLEKCKESIKSNDASYHNLECSTKDYYSKIENLEAKLDELFQKLESKGESSKKLKDLFVSSYDLDEEIERETRHKESNVTEAEYMKKEIERAKESLKESVTEISKITTEITDLKNDVTKISHEFNESSNKLKLNITVLKDDIVVENSKLTKLEDNLAEMVNKLKKIPVQRIRSTNLSSNGSNHSSSRRKKD